VRYLRYLRYVRYLRYLRYVRYLRYLRYVRYEARVGDSGLTGLTATSEARRNAIATGRRCAADRLLAVGQQGTSLVGQILRQFGVAQDACGMSSPGGARYKIPLPRQGNLT
jgi:hypothetical protein